tara:strand:+ start:25 stop:366 length:342 start_codon:yes stop_codon:yes gene_type:complete
VNSIKWSKKLVISKDWMMWNSDYKRVNSNIKIDVYIYSWNEYKLIKELYGENRSYYFLAKGNDYLCDESGYRARMFNNINHATKHLEYILENGLMSKDRWVNPNEERITNVLT